jgi:transketolase
MTERELWTELGQQLRVDSVRMTAIAGSGHPTSAMSAADLMAVLITKYLRYDFARSGDPRNDHLIFSKGHASPLLYAIFKAVGAIGDEELHSYRKLGSPFEGHPSPRLPWVDVATGSLGQGLPVGLGIALAAKRLDRLPARVWVLCGDSEMAEGSIWEAAAHASFASLDNLIAVIDVNRLGQSGETMLGWDTAAYVTRLHAFGWRVLEIDGHDVVEIDRAYAVAVVPDGRPVAIVARTVKGQGVRAVANRNGFHGKPLDDPESAVQELGGVRDLRVDPPKPRGHITRIPSAGNPEVSASWTIGEQVATRRAYGEALVALGHRNARVVALEGEVGNSTYSGLFAAEHPDRFFEMYVAEQKMIAVAVGMQVCGWIPYASLFGAFLSRAYDFVRMAAISRANIRLVGSHAGVSIGEDGPSQMALEDIASLRAVHGSTVLYPCCANQTARLVDAMADRAGIVYLRTTRSAAPVLYESDESFKIGGSRVLRASEEDALAIIAAGITVHEALAAHEELLAEGIRSRVIDLYSIKPLDRATLTAAAEATGGIVTVEDHWAEGGLGDAVLDALADARLQPRVIKLAVRELQGSGKPAELLHAAGIDRHHIAGAARKLVAESIRSPVPA